MEHKKQQRTDLKKFLETDAGPLCSILSRCIPYGIAYHHSGLTSDERRHIEDAFRLNILCVICCTSTLAAGVNLPAKRVILRSPYIGRNFITLSRYKQMVGRAGRAGMCGDVGESILVCSPRDNIRVSELLCSPMDEAASSLHANESKGIQNMVLSAIGLGLATCRTDIQKLMSITLMSLQSKRLSINTSKLTDEVIENLFKLKAVTLAETSNLMQANISCIEFETQQGPASQMSYTETRHQQKPINTATLNHHIVGGHKKLRNIKLKPSTQMTISKLGRASFKSGFDLIKAQIIYKDLMQAQRSLVLLNYMHLLYIVTPYEPVDINVYPDMSIYYSQVSSF